MLRLNRKYTVFYHIGIWSVLFSCIMLWRSYNHGPRMELVGNYGLSIHFSDGHGTGIFSFRDLWECCPCEACEARRVEGAKPGR